MNLAARATLLLARKLDEVVKEGVKIHAFRRLRQSPNTPHVVRPRKQVRQRAALEERTQHHLKGAKSAHAYDGPRCDVHRDSQRQHLAGKGKPTQFFYQHGDVD